MTMYNNQLEEGFFIYKIACHVVVNTILFKIENEIASLCALKQDKSVKIKRKAECQF